MPELKFNSRNKGQADINQPLKKYVLKNSDKKHSKSKFKKNEVLKSESKSTNNKKGHSRVFTVKRIEKPQMQNEKIMDRQKSNKELNEKFSKLMNYSLYKEFPDLVSTQTHHKSSSKNLPDLYSRTNRM